MELGEPSIRRFDADRGRERFWNLPAQLPKCKDETRRLSAKSFPFLFAEFLVLGRHVYDVVFEYLPNAIQTLLDGLERVPKWQVWLLSSVESACNGVAR